MKPIQFILTISHFLGLAKCEMQAFVVQGKNAKISAFPHSAFLSVSCKLNKERDAEVCICGSSIINQQIILTAAHCLSGCEGSLSLTASVGSEDIYNGIPHTVSSYTIHEKYDDVKVFHDIALGKLRTPLKFNSRIKRVVLMKNPPYNEEAIAAGWGLVDEVKEKMTRKLKFTKQYVARKSDCVRVFHDIPDETLCASNRDKSSYMSHGDSGSALIVRGYIQIGIVSYKQPEISRSAVVYTDVGRHYEWIMKATNKLICSYVLIFLVAER